MRFSVWAILGYLGFSGMKVGSVSLRAHAFFNLTILAPLSCLGMSLKAHAYFFEDVGVDMYIFNIVDVFDIMDMYIFNSMDTDSQSMPMEITRASEWCSDRR